MLVGLLSVSASTLAAAPAPDADIPSLIWNQPAPHSADATACVPAASPVASRGIAVGPDQNPVFVGDTLRSETECVAVRESKSRPNAGIVTWAHRSFNQRDELVCECTRTALLLKKPD